MTLPVGNKLMDFLTDTGATYSAVNTTVAQKTSQCISVMEFWTSTKPFTLTTSIMPIRGSQPETQLLILSECSSPALGMRSPL